MLIVGQRVQLSDGVYRVKEVDSFKAKVVQEVTEIREFTTRFDKKVKIKAKPKVKYISPNAELKILKDIPLKAEPKQKLPTEKIKIPKKSKADTKSPLVVKPKPVKKEAAKLVKPKTLVVKKAAKSVVKSKPVAAKKAPAKVIEPKTVNVKKPHVVKQKQAAVKKVITPVVNPQQIFGQKISPQKKKSKPKKNKFEQLNLF